MATRTSRKITTFAEAIHVEPLESSNSNNESSFEATIPWDWCGPAAAHGGHLQSLVFATARRYFELLETEVKAKQLDPIASHMQFISRVQAGKVRIVATPLSIGVRVSIVRIEIKQSTAQRQQSVTKDSGARRKKEQSGAETTCILATVTQGNLSTEQGVSLPTRPSIPKEEIPDRKLQCEEYTVPSFVAEIAPIVLKIEQRRKTGATLQGMYVDRYGPSTKEGWYRIGDGSRFDVLSLGYLTDCFSGAPNNYSPNSEDYKVGIHYLTLSMATEIKRDPKGAEWLFMRIRSREIRNGRFDSDVTVCDEEGNLIALSRHVSLVIDRAGMGGDRGVFRL